MQRLIATVFTVALLAQTASARVAAPAPLGHRVASADAIVVGKVASIEEKAIQTSDGGGPYLVAVVEVGDALMGLKDAKTVRVAFMAGNRRFPQNNLTPGQEVTLFLANHPKDKVYTIDNYWDVLDKKTNADYAKELDITKRCAKLLADPKAGLASKDADERMLTALLVLSSYRNERRAEKTEAVSAEESKALLTALAEGDWSKNDPKLHGYQLTPAAVFMRLGLTEKDGWKPMPVRDPSQIAEPAKKWLKDNAGTYRVQKYVQMTDK
jgi:hypothetical protein